MIPFVVVEKLLHFSYNLSWHGALIANPCQELRHSHASLGLLGQHIAYDH